MNHNMKLTSLITKTHLHFLKNVFYHYKVNIERGISDMSKMKMYRKKTFTTANNKIFSCCHIRAKVVNTGIDDHFLENVPVE